MKNTLSLILILATILSLGSCKKGSKGENSLLPNVTGSAGEVVVVLPKSLITDSLGVDFKSILTQEFPYLPQSEPIFDLVMIPTSAFTDIFKSHRNIILTDISSDLPASKFILKHDVWAAPQTVLYIVGPNYKSITDFVKQEQKRIVTVFEQAERDRIIQNAIKYEEREINPVLEKKFNITMNIPSGYKINLQTENFIWISHETPEISQGIIIYSYPYTNKNTFTADFLAQKRDEFVKQIQGPNQGTYMITSKVIPPQFSEMMYNNRYFGVLRGFWDVYRHPMGGPFISFTTVDEKRQLVITEEAYVYAPMFNKRNYLRQAEALLYTFKLN